MNIPWPPFFRRHPMLVSILFLLPTFPTSAHATDYTTQFSTGPVYWTNVTWVPAGAPASTDNVTLLATNSLATTFQTSGNRTVNNLTLGGANGTAQFSFLGGTGTNADTLTVNGTLLVTNRTTVLSSVSTNHALTITATNLTVDTGATGRLFILGSSNGRVNLDVAGNTLLNSGTIYINRGDQAINLGHLTLGTLKSLWLSGSNFVNDSGTNYTVTVRSLTGTASSFITNYASTHTTLEILGENVSATTYEGVIVDGAGLTTVVKKGGGTQIFKGTNTYTGGTLISGGMLQLGAGGTPGSVAGAITNNASLTINHSGTFSFTNVVSGSGALVKSGTGTTTLAGSNTFSGATTITGGTLQLNGTPGAALGSTASVVVTNGAILLISQSNQVNDAAAITLSGGTITRGSGVNEAMGNLSLTAGSTLDYGVGTVGTLQFDSYTPSSLLTVNNFLEGNKLIFASNLSDSINNTNKFAFDNDFTSSWDEDASLFTITAIPEPSTIVAALGLTSLLLWPMRRRVSVRPQPRTK